LAAIDHQLKDRRRNFQQRLALLCEVMDWSVCRFGRNLATLAVAEEVRDEACVSINFSMRMLSVLNHPLIVQQEWGPVGCRWRLAMLCSLPISDSNLAAVAGVAAPISSKCIRSVKDFKLQFEPLKVLSANWPRSITSSCVCNY